MADAKNSAANPCRLTGQSTDLFSVDCLQNRRLGLFSRQMRECDGEAWKTRWRLKTQRLQRRGLVYLRARGIPALIKKKGEEAGEKRRYKRDRLFRREVFQDFLSHKRLKIFRYSSASGSASRKTKRFSS